MVNSLGCVVENVGSEVFAAGQIGEIVKNAVERKVAVAAVTLNGNLLKISDP
jgi:hypothetical protein